MERQSSYLRLYIRHFKYFKKYGGFSLPLYMFFAIFLYVLYPVKLLVQGMFVDSVIDFYRQTSLLHIGSYMLPAPMVYMSAWLGLIILKEVIVWLKDTAYDRLRFKVYFRYVSHDLARRIHRFNLQEIERNDIFNKLETYKTYWWTAALTVINRTNDLIGAILSMVMTLFTIKGVSVVVITVAILLPVIKFAVQYIQEKIYRRFVEQLAIPLRKRSYYINVLLDIRTFMERKVNSLHKYLRRLLMREEDYLRRAYTAHSIHKKNWLHFASIYDLMLLSLLQFYVVATSIIRKVQVGMIWANVNYIDNLHQKSALLLTVVGELIANLRYVKDLYDIYDMKGFADKHWGQVVIKGRGAPPSLSFKRLNFSFGRRSRRFILKNANLTINPREKILILGRDGAGKTALVKILTTLFPVPFKSYYVNNIPVEEYARGEIKNLFSLVPEDFGRYYVPFKKNIILGDPMRKFDKKQYNTALKITGLDKWLKQSKINPETIPLGTYFYPGVELPSGLWQRIAIARAIYRDRPVYILDEPFSYIDSAAKYSIFHNLANYLDKYGKTLIYIGEDIDFLDYFDAVYEKLGNGRLVRITKAKAKREWGGGRYKK